MAVWTTEIPETVGPRAQNPLNQTPCPLTESRRALGPTEPWVPQGPGSAPIPGLGSRELITGSSLVTGSPERRLYFLYLPSRPRGTSTYCLVSGGHPDERPTNARRTPDERPTNARRTPDERPGPDEHPTNAPGPTRGGGFSSSSAPLNQRRTRILLLAPRGEDHEENPPPPPPRIREEGKGSPPPPQVPGIIYGILLGDWVPREETLLSLPSLPTMRG